MATYVMSDLHGQFEAYQRMLNLISFNEDEDILYLLGDYVDWGPDSIKLLLHLASKTSDNIKCLMGNHDLLMYNTIAIYNDFYKADPEYELKRSHDYKVWRINGGNITFEEYKKLSETDRKTIEHWLKNLDYVVSDLEVCGRKFYLSHAYPHLTGVSLHDVVWNRIENDRLTNRFMTKYPDTTLISGHTITSWYSSFDDRGKCKIYHSKRIPYINIDCGAKVFGDIDYQYGRLACLRLDDMQEFYIE